MKKATKKVIDYFPFLEKHIPDSESVILEEQTLEKFSEVEQVFLKLVWFFEQPEKNNFNLYDIYSSLDGDWLSYALECIFFYFSEDTFLMNEPNFSLITDETELYNQSDFANYLLDHVDKHNIKFSRQMISTYSKRGTLPDPDLVIGRKKYWKKDTCEAYLEHISNINN